MTPLDRLIAIDAIQQLKARYFRFVDTKDWAGLAGVFTKDAIFDGRASARITPLGGETEGNVGLVREGRDAIVEWISGSLSVRTSVHHGHCHEVTIDSDSEAHGTIAMMDHIRKPDRTTDLLWANGHYHETYRVEDGQWRIAETRLTRLFCDFAPGGF